MRLWVRGEVGRLTNLRAAEAAKAGNPGPEMSIAKLEFAEFNKELYSFCIDLLGADGMVGYDYTFRRPTEIDATGTTRGRQYAFLRVRANSIEGGTSEILRNILGEQVLGPARRAAGRQGSALVSGAAQLTRGCEAAR